MEDERISYARYRHTLSLLKEDGFSRAGKKIDFTDYMSSEPSQAADALRHRLTHLVSGLKILDADGPLGVFNRHDKPHLERVFEISHGLLDWAEELSGEPITDHERNAATAITFLHDLGNNLHRKNHGVHSIKLFDKIFQGCDQDDPLVETIKTGILLHDEHLGTQVEDFSLLNDEKPQLLARPIWAVIAADKLDIGRHRISSALSEHMPVTFDEVVETTPHTLILLYAKDTKLEKFPDGIARFTIDFSTSVDMEKDDVIKKTLRQFIWKDNDMYVPKTWHENWRDHDIPYSASYLGNLRSLYASRFSMMLSCLFALYPSLQEFQLQVNDDKKYIKTTIMSSYPRDAWQEIEFMIWKKGKQSAYKQHSLVTPPILKKGEAQYLERKGYST